MPRVRPLTEAARKAEAEKTQRQRVTRIIEAAAAARGLTRQQLSDMAGIGYQPLNRRMRGESDFSMTELCRISDALLLDCASRAALCGAKEKCRFEPGYRAGTSGA